MGRTVRASPGDVPVGRQAHAFQATYDIGYAGWVFLLAGTVASACGWPWTPTLEPVTLAILACLPPFGPRLETSSTRKTRGYGLILGGSLAPQTLVGLGGLLVALAVCHSNSHFSCGATLRSCASRRRFRFSVPAGTVAAVLVPLLAFGSTNVLRAMALGSGIRVAPEHGGPRLAPTWLAPRRCLASPSNRCHAVGLVVDPTTGESARQPLRSPLSSPSR